MANTSGGSSMDGAAGCNMASRNDGQSVTSSSHSGSGHITKVSSARRRAHPPMRLGSEVPVPSQKKRKVLNEEEAPCGVSNAGKISAPSSAASRDPNGTSSCEDHAGGHTSEYASDGNARGSPIKRRCMRRSRYLALFSSLKGEHTDEVVKSKQSTVPTKTKKVKESQFQKLRRLPDGCHPDYDNDHLCSVNKLLEFRHKSQGAVFVDDKEHVMKIIFFISLVLPDACHSFLLVTTSSLPLWKAEFNRLAPSINVVVFDVDGEKDVLKLIQNPEFHENGSHTMLHVLLAHPVVILEDIKSVESIVWESVIVDYCQDSVAKHLKQLKQLPTDFRIVLLSSPLKDSLPEYKNLLDFLNSEQENNGDYIEADSLAMLRARFTRHIAYERKAGSSKFLEYWVPAYLSQVQLELYSSILHANSSVLQSQMTTDSVGALCDVVMSLWKCCNHPCLVDLQHSLANTRDITESTDDIMCVSGKLLLLEKMLVEIRNKSLRVIVLFQSDGTVGDRMGNILEDLVRHKFGPESYERVQNRSAFAMKQEAMNMFNDTTKGRFVFLIDSRACQPSINLSSIDSIIIYGSDLNPLNDLKALRKIKIGSQLKYVRIFRLYTPFTVEEKSLVLAKQSMIIDSNSQDITSSLSHCLVSWGVSFLFNRVDELQQDNCTSKSNERGTVFMDKVILEFLTELSTEVEDSSKVNSTTISKACMSDEFYSRNITLIGEREGVSSLDGDPPKFWLNLLDGKSYCQRYKPIEVATEETNTSRRKRRNTCEIAGPSSKVRLDVINHDLLPEISTPSSADLHLLPETGVENMSTPKSLHAELKRELSKLMTVLKLPSNRNSTTLSTSNLSTLPFSGEAETENCQASMPAQEITSPHVQHSLATSQHPVSSDLQPPTLILSEAERAGLLCTSASQDLQPSVAIQEDVPLERTDLSGMPMTQSATVLQMVEPSFDPHAEEAGTCGMLSAPDLQSGMQASSPLQGQLVEAEGAGISGTTPAQNLQPETQPSTSAQHIPPERTHPDERIQIGLQPNTTSGAEQLAQLSTVAPATLLRGSKPLINELERLKYYNAVLSKNHEHKKLQLQTECNEEMEKVKEKYELLLQEEDSAYHRLTTDLYRIYTKVFAHQLLAENFWQEKFKEFPVQERSASPTVWQSPQSSQHALCGTTAAQTTLLPVASSLATRPPVLISSHTAGPYLQTSQVARPPASGAIQPQPVLSGNLSRAAASPVGSMPPRNGIYGAVGAQSRGPAPHLQQLRMSAPSTIVRRDEQQPIITNPGFVPSRQPSPGMFESSASGNALAGIPLTSTAPSSVHQAMPSASNLHPAFPASSLLPGSGPDSMANFVQSNSRIPVGMASQQAPGLNQAFHHMGGGPLSTESRIQQALAHIGGTAQAAPDQSQEALHRILQRFPQVMAPSSVQPTASSSHPAPMAARQQAGFPNPAPDNMAGPLNAAAGVGNPVVGIGNQSYQLSASLFEWEALRRVGPIPGHAGTYPQGGAGLTGGPPGTSPQGSSGISREVVCLSDDEE